MPRLPYFIVDAAERRVFYPNIFIAQLQRVKKSLIFALLSEVKLVCLCLLSCSVVSSSLQLHGLQPAKLLCPWNFAGKNMGVGCHFLLQEIFLIQGLSHVSCIGRWIFYHWSHLNLSLLLLLLLSHFSRVRLCATPQTAAHQAPLSLGFSRQEHYCKSI